MRTWLTRTENYTVESKHPKFPVVVVELGKDRYMRIHNDGSYHVYVALAIPPVVDFELVEEGT